MIDGISGIQIGPGAAAFTLIPLPSISKIWLKLAEKFWIAPFVAAYGRSCSLGEQAFTEVPRCVFFVFHEFDVLNRSF